MVTICSTCGDRTPLVSPDKEEFECPTCYCTVNKYRSPDYKFVPETDSGVLVELGYVILREYNNV